jgi:hypothetical protein
MFDSGVKRIDSLQCGAERSVPVPASNAAAGHRAPGDIIELNQAG